MKNLLIFLKDSNVLPVSLSESAKQILDCPKLTNASALLIKSIWSNPTVRKITMEAEPNLQGGYSGASYYFENSVRFAEDGFKPNREDILRARKITVGTTEARFVIKGVQFVIVDVGGRRSERKKWLQCFGGVSAVIFMVAMNEYDMVLEEDMKTNRLIESLKLWKFLTSSDYFENTPFILFLNKSDTFKEKITVTSLGDIFSDYDAFSKSSEIDMLSDYDKGCRFISNQFKQNFSISRKEGVSTTNSFFCVVTSTLDSSASEEVFLSIRDNILVTAKDVIM